MLISTSWFLSTDVSLLISTNPRISIKALQIELQQKLQVNISFHKTFRAKKIAEKKMTSDNKQQYALFRDYAMELKAKKTQAQQSRSKWKPTQI